MEYSAIVSTIFFIALLLGPANSAIVTSEFNLRRESPTGGLCTSVVDPSGFSCSEHTVQTQDGFVLGIQRVSAPSAALIGKGPPALLIHGLFMGGDCWFMNSQDESLGSILANRGYDVWVGNVRATSWSHGHVSLKAKDKKFWDWSWQEMALYDLAGMLQYIYSETGSKILLIGHSQGTIISLAALTQPNIAAMVEAAALLCPISYLDHITSPFVLRLVHMRIDEVILAMGIHELNFKSEIGTKIMDMMCKGHLDCEDMLSSITGKNCCFNSSRIDTYLEFEPHPTSSKNLNHLFQMIRKASFEMYDYGTWRNLVRYGQRTPPQFNISSIPSSLPMWMGYGGNDALADVWDVRHSLRDLISKPQLLYLENYGHIDFILSTSSRQDVYESMLAFFSSLESSSSTF